MAIQPRWGALGQFLANRRRELSREFGQDLSTPMRLRATTNRLPARWNNSQTIYTLEKGRPLSMETLLYLPEMYRVGLQEILQILLPEYMENYSRVADRLSALPWLEPIMEAISVQPEPVVKMFKRLTVDVPIAEKAAS